MLTDKERQAALGWMRGLRVQVDHEMALVAFSTLAELAAAHGLSVYDAAYLELAIPEGLPLATRDQTSRPPPGVAEFP